MIQLRSLFGRPVEKKPTTQTQPDHQKTIRIDGDGPCLQQRNQKLRFGLRQFGSDEDLGGGVMCCGVRWFPGGKGFSGRKKTTYLGGCLKYLLIFIPIWGRFAFWLIFFKWLKPPTRYTLPPFADDIFIWWFWKETIGSLSLGTPKNRISSLFHYFTSYNGFYTSQVVTLRQTNIAKTGKWTMKEDVNSYIKWGIFLPAMLGTTGG